MGENRTMSTFAMAVRMFAKVKLRSVGKVVLRGLLIELTRQSTNNSNKNYIPSVNAAICTFP